MVHNVFQTPQKNTLKHFPVGWPQLHCVSELLNVNALTTVFCLSPQLGFGSFLGIIGAHLIENKRQMVRGFILPLRTRCLQTHGNYKLRRLRASTGCHWLHKGLMKLWTLMLRAAISTQPVDCFLLFLFLKHAWVSILRQWGELRPEIEKGCKRSRTGVQCGIWGRKL